MYRDRSGGATSDFEIDLPVTYRVSGVQGIARVVSLGSVGCTITGVTADASSYLELSITVPGRCCSN